MEEERRGFSVLTNPHGDEMACNVWCTGETHAVVLLARGSAPWFAALGWQIRHARCAEADPAQVFAALSAGPGRGAVLTTPTPQGFSHEEIARLPPDFSPWLVTVALLPSGGGLA